MIENIRDRNWYNNWKKSKSNKPNNLLYHEKNTIDNAMSKKNKIILLDELDEGFKKKEIQSKYNSIALIVKKTKKKFTKKVFGLILFTNHIIYYLVLFNE